MRSSWPAERILGWLLPVLALVAEGAWLAVVYVALETTIDGQPPLLGTLELALAAGLAAIGVRRGWLRPDDNPLTFFVLLIAIGAVGWLWDATPRALLLEGNLAEAIGYHPGGWLMLVAAMRGVGRGAEIDDRALTRLVLVGIPALAFPWALGQVAAGDLRPVFTEEAFVASLTFVSAGFMAAGLARLREIGRETGVDWRTNRSWLATVLAVLAVVLAVGIPAASLLGLPVEAVARGMLGPLLTLLGYAFVALAIAFAVLTVALHELLLRIGFSLPPPMTPTELDRLPDLPEYTFDQLRGPLLTVAIFWIAIAILAVVVSITWVRRRRRGRARTGEEERSFRIPDASFRLPMPRLRPPRRTALARPHDAVTAYLGALDDIAARDTTRARAEHETPRAHARRLALGPELDALQADYALARYGGRVLTTGEHRRALGRWRRLRRRLGG